MKQMHSLLDPNRNLFISKDYWTVGVLKESEGNHVFLLEEGLDENENYILKRFDYRSNDVLNNKVEIDTTQITSSVEEAHSTFKKFINGASFLGFANEFHKEFIDGLNKNISASEENPNEYLYKFPKNGDSIGCHGLFCKHNHKEPYFAKEASFKWVRDILYSFTWDGNKPFQGFEQLKVEKQYDYKGQKKTKNINNENSAINSQLVQFDNAIKNISDISSLNSDQKDNVVWHLKSLKDRLETEYHNNPDNPATSFLLGTFIDFSNKLPDVTDKTTLLQRVDSLCERLDKAAVDTKLHQPMNKNLKSSICGVIGAVIGFAIGAVVGAAITSWGGGFGALPGAILGTTYGVALGAQIGLGAGGFLGSLFGLFHKKDNQLEFEKKQLLINQCANEVDDLKKDQKRIAGISKNAEKSDKAIEVSEQGSEFMSDAQHALRTF